MVFRHLLESWHPSLYWYTPRDSMSAYFDEGYAAIRDSMTEPQFRTILSYVIAKVDCGHTSIRASKAYAHYLDTAKLPQFPLILKFWPDTMVVSANLNRRDSVLKRGTLILSINGRTTQQLTDTLFDYIVTDGLNQTGKYQYLSTGLHFSSWYHDIFGYSDSFDIGYRDTSGLTKLTRIPLYDPRADTLRKSLGHTLQPGTGQRPPGPAQRIRPADRRRRKQRELVFIRSLQLDTAGHTAFITLNTFEHGYHLRRFFHHAFTEIKQRQIKNLVVDVRSNGGGDASLSTLLTRYLIDKRFKVADSLYTIRRHSRYDRYINNGFLYDVLTLLASRKRSDGKYHFGYFERHYYSPLHQLHFDGHVYILTGGNSFSATCLFAGALKGQSNVTLVGEETGGGFYGNTAWMIPDATLPITKVRFRLPRFRLVVDRQREKNGRGILPDVEALPTIDAIGKGFDFKTARVKELIRQNADKN
ncbi:peptidase S41 [Puia dinghuensis]|uniref:Peptidase S41 n=2 Tax=Puia dinghuensis TaxID=1792502 RepID=A0A8J2UG46_9BACT|nr:peptidase S41 [Puia dinghuensis]